MLFLTDPYRTGEPVDIHMSVTLDQAFSDDLRNSSSVLYKKYKDDFENAVMTLVLYPWGYKVL